MPFFKLNDIFAGRYVVVELLGEENSSEVWRAKDHLADDAEVVLKIYAPENGLDDKGLRELKHEFSLSQHLAHPHLLRIYHFDIWEGAAYLVMPFNPMGTLKDQLREGDTLNEKQIALILSQIGSALEKLHSQEPPILHQHVSPENIVKSQPDYFLLAGYGIGSQIRHPRPVSDTAYAPPEYFDRNQYPDASGDVFSLGVILYELCTKSDPWGGANSQILLKGGQVPELPEQYSRELNELLHACMSADRGKRPSAEELHLRGKNFLETGSWTLSGKEVEKDKRFKRIIAYSLATAVFVLFMIGAFWEYKNGDLAAPVGNFQKMAASGDQEDEVDAMLVEMLEIERSDLARRTLELERKNKELAYQDSINQILLKNQEQVIEEYQKGKEVTKGQVKESNTAKAKTVASSPVVVSNQNRNLSSSKELEKQLNKISDPSLSGKARTAWKEETLARFSEGAVRIVDETDGTPKQYSASIFLNLLYNVPHTIVVKEVKTDQKRKVTELRLTMQTKM